MTALLKAGHIAALVVWCAGLLALPILLRRYGHASDVGTQSGYSEFRLLIHAAYTRIATPAAVLAIGFGIALILERDLTEPWLVAKLAAVACMVLIHAALGHVTVRVAEEMGNYDLPPVIPLVPVAAVLMTIVLVLVLAKPDLRPLLDRLPDWLLRPQGRELPSGLVPI